MYYLNILHVVEHDYVIVEKYLPWCQRYNVLFIDDMRSALDSVMRYMNLKISYR